MQVCSSFIKPSDAALSNMGEFVTQMHTDSGLLQEIPQGITIAEAEQQVLQYIKQWVAEERTAPLAGNSIGTDRMFLNRQMPLLDKLPALSQHRCQFAQGANQALVPQGLLPASKENWQPPSPCGHPGIHSRAALLPQGDLGGSTGSRFRNCKGYS